MKSKVINTISDSPKVYSKVFEDNSSALELVCLKNYYSI